MDRPHARHPCHVRTETCAPGPVDRLHLTGLMEGKLRPPLSHARIEEASREANVHTGVESA